MSCVESCHLQLPNLLLLVTDVQKLFEKLRLLMNDLSTH